MLTTNKILPLQDSENVQIVVPFCEIPDAYDIVQDNDKSSDHPRPQEIQEIFAANPSARTLVVLFDKDNDNQIRSVYGSSSRIDDGSVDYREKTDVMFSYVSGEKLVGLVMEVSCDLPAHGQVAVMIPQGASPEEIIDMARCHAMSIKNWDDDPFSFEEDWSETEGLRINRLVDVIRGPDKNTAQNIARNIPVEGAPSRYGVDIVEMLKSAEYGATIPPAVFMYASARHAMASGEDFNSEFLQRLKTAASIASENAVYEHMMANSPLSAEMSALAPNSDDVVQYRAGSVLRGPPDTPREYTVYKGRWDQERIVLAGLTVEDMKISGTEGLNGVIYTCDAPNATDCIVEKGAMHVINSDFSDYFVKREAFMESFSEMDQEDKVDALVKYFSYQKHESKPSSGMDMSTS